MSVRENNRLITVKIGKKYLRRRSLEVIGYKIFFLVINFIKHTSEIRIAAKTAR